MSREYYLPGCFTMSVIELDNGGKIEVNHENGQIKFYPWSTVHKPGDICGLMDEELVLDARDPNYRDICEFLAKHFEHWSVNGNAADFEDEESEPASALPPPTPEAIEVSKRPKPEPKPVQSELSPELQAWVNK